MFRYLVLGILIGMTSCTTTPNAKSAPSQEDQIINTFISFFEYCTQKKYDKAESLLARMRPEVSKDYVSERLALYGEIGLGKKENILKVHIVKDKAVIAYMEKKTDYDPIYFIREDNKWRILLKLTYFPKKHYSWPDKTFNEFEQLKKWFKDYKGKNLYGRK